MGKSLVGERVAHHKRRVAGCAAKVHQSAFSQNNNAVAIGEVVLVNLRFDVHFLDSWQSLKVSHHNLVVEVADVADNGFVLHLLHMLGGDDVAVAGAGNVDVALRKSVLNGCNLKAFHCGLQSANRVNLGNQNTGTESTHTHCAALAYIAVAANHGHFAGNHNVGGTLDAVGQTLTAAVEVIEFRFCY